MAQREKKHLTLNIDSEIANKAVADPNIKVSETIEKYLKICVTSSETTDKEKLYKNYKDLFKVMLPLLQKFRVRTKIGEEYVFFDAPDTEEPEPVYGDNGEVIGYESPEPVPSDTFYFYLEPHGSLSHDHYDIKNIKEIPIERFYRPEQIIDELLDSIQEGVEYREDQDKQIEMAKTIIDAITKGTIPKPKKSKSKKRERK